MIGALSRRLLPARGSVARPNPEATHVSPDERALHDFADDLHRRLARAAAAFESSLQPQDAGFSTSDLERLVGLAEAVGPEAKQAALTAAAALDGARTALMAAARGSHAQRSAAVSGTKAAVAEGVRAINVVCYRDYAP